MSAGSVGPLVLRVWWRGLQWLNGGQILGALPPRVASFDLLCQTNTGPVSCCSNWYSYDDWTPSRYSFCNHSISADNIIENLVGGQALTLRLSGVQGLVTSMTVMIRDSTQSTYIVLYSLLDS